MVTRLGRTLDWRLLVHEHEVVAGSAIRRLVLLLLRLNRILVLSAHLVDVSLCLWIASDHADSGVICCLSGLDDSLLTRTDIGIRP